MAVQKPPNAPVTAVLTTVILLVDPAGADVGAAAGVDAAAGGAVGLGADCVGAQATTEASKSGPTKAAQKVRG